MLFRSISVTKGKKDKGGISVEEKDKINQEEEDEDNEDSDRDKGENIKNPAPTPDPLISTFLPSDQDEDQQDLPEWASFEFDPRKWYELLDERGVDQHARKKLFILASLNDEGKQEAWHLVLKLLHDWQEHRIRNPSKFIQKCSSNALEFLTRKYPQLHFA